MRGWHITRRSSNAKTGPIVVTTSTESTCPATCPLKGSGCYADNYHLRLHWDKVTSGERGETFDDHLAALASLPGDAMVRLNQAGDLPGDGASLDFQRTRDYLRAAGDGRVAWTYTHYTAPTNVDVLQGLRGAEFATVNLSANNLEEADALAASGMPTVTLTASAEKVQRTPEGRRVVLCPAQSSDDVTCATCGGGRPLCSRDDRQYIVGFHVHGSGANKALRVVNDASGGAA